MNLITYFHPIYRGSRCLDLIQRVYETNKYEESEIYKMFNFDEVKHFLLEKTKVNASNFDDKLPFYSENGQYVFTEYGGWTGGFWSGLNFLCYELTGKQFYLDAARASRHRFVKRLYENPESLDHDIGFLYGLSCVADYKITGNEEAKKIALDAADALIGRFNESGQFIQAWNVRTPGDPFSEENRGRIIIDCMYNLPFLFWATEVTGDEKYKRVAVGHANTCAKHIIRSDYTSFHCFVFDPETGEPKYGKTYQGYADDSCWSRGQSWAIGGFTYAYSYTGDEKYLEIAKNCATVFISLLEDDHVPMWDFKLPNKKGESRDTSSGAIAAASFLELSKYVTDDEKEYYVNWAKKILESLYLNYSTKDKTDEEGLLVHGCGHKPKNKMVDCSLIYGDYYFAEAVVRLLDGTVRYW